MSAELNIANTVEGTIIKELVTTTFKLFSDFIKNKLPKEKVRSEENQFEERILSHFNELYIWSKEIEFIGLSKPIIVNENTINLNFYFTLTRENKIEINEANTVDEDHLINCFENIMIEGNPGSGKTTTLKRLLSYYFFDKNNRQSRFSYPVLIRFRAIEPNVDLYIYICHILGITYQQKVRQIMVQNKVTREVKINGVITTEYYLETEVREEIYYQINNIDIGLFIAELLDRNNVLLILDGLDELKPELKIDVYKQIKELMLRISKAKMLITTRPNYIDTTLPNCSIYQVNELNMAQMKEIANRWLPNSDDFFDQLKNKSYFELANRPLFLSFLILLYSDQPKNNPRVLPRFSKDVYEDILELLLNRWDKGRDIARVSKYSYFGTKQKIEFLAAIAFKLTYIIKCKIFSRKDLIRVYKQIHEKFDLPDDEAYLVAEELESHTGILIKSFYDTYEFSHLAIQEFLCAIYIRASPFNENIKDYLKEYPAPLAVSVALSSDPSFWFYELVLKAISTIKEEDAITQLFSQLLDRLCIESPFFERSERSGLAILVMCKQCNCTNLMFLSSIESFIKTNKNISLSIEDILEGYTVTSRSARNQKIFSRKYHIINTIPLPLTVALPLNINLGIKI